MQKPPPDYFGPIVFALLMALFLALGAFSFVAIGKSLKKEQIRAEEAKKMIISESLFGRTILHDKHWYIDWYGSNLFTHHPDCPCGKSDGNVILENEPRNFSVE